MPPKDIQPTGPLMFSTDGGKTMEPLGNITEVDLTEGCDEPYEDAFTELIPWGMVEFLAPCVNRRTLMTIVFGRKITNNWLKMHGIPMERNAWRRRKHGHRSRQSPKGRQTRPEA